MSLIKLCSIAVYILIANLSIGQKTIVSGTVIDATTKETVPFATVSFSAGLLSELA